MSKITHTLSSLAGGAATLALAHFFPQAAAGVLRPVVPSAPASPIVAPALSESAARAVSQWGDAEARAALALRIGNADALADIWGLYRHYRRLGLPPAQAYAEAAREIPAAIAWAETNQD